LKKEKKIKDRSILKKRPKVLSLICILGFLWIVFTFPGMFSPATKKMGDWVPAIYGLLIALSFISFIGIWNLKRWGVELYIGVFFAKMIFFTLTSQFEGDVFVGILFSIWFILTFLRFYKRLQLNL
jgi:membrane protease YdiL (CAAX protease family)